MIEWFIIFIELKYRGLFNLAPILDIKMVGLLWVTHYDSFLTVSFTEQLRVGGLVKVLYYYCFNT